MYRGRKHHFHGVAEMERPDYLLREIELDTSRLKLLDSIKALRDFRSGEVTLIWTPLPGMDVCILNLLSPRQQVFWSFGEYAAFGRGRFRVGQALLGKPETLARITALLSKSGDAKSFYSHVLLGGLTRYFGDKFIPRELGAGYFLLAQRHDSIVVPNVCRPSVTLYFQRMAKTVATDAAYPCEEQYSLAGDRPDVSICADLLSVPVEVMGAERCRNVQYELRTIGASYRDWQPGREFELRYGCRGGIHVGLIRRPTRPTLLESFAEIVRFRVNVAATLCALPVVERVKIELDMPGWHSRDLADLRNELRSLLDSELSTYPGYETDPFEGWPEAEEPPYSDY